MLNTEHKKEYWLKFLPFFFKTIFDKSAHRDPHFVSHLNGPSVDITPHGDPGGYSDFSSYVGSGPASTVHQKTSRISSTPKNI